MKKYLSFLAFVLFASLLIFTLSACGGDDDDDDAGDSGSGSGTPEYVDPTLTPAGRAAVAVDLGLPSGVLWADRNVGAETSVDFGDYFAWGETETKTCYDWSTYNWGASSKALTKYCTNSAYGKIDGKVSLELSDDAARAKWGGHWMTPSLDDFKELVENTNATCVTDYNGVAGYMFTSKKDNSKFIFLPEAGLFSGTEIVGGGAGGYNMSITLYSAAPSNAYYLYLENYEEPEYNKRYYNRTRGYNVRPVLKYIAIY